MVYRRQREKFEEIALFERVMKTEMSLVRAECDRAGLAIEGRTDEEVRRLLLSHLRKPAD